MAIVVAEAKMKALVVNSKEPCEHCGVTAVLNPHRMDKQKLATLRDIVRLHRTNKWIRVEQGRKLIGCDDGKGIETAYCSADHANRLVWFNLAERQEARTPNYRASIKGVAFLLGEHKVPCRILCRKGEVVYASKEQTGVSDIKADFDKEYWDSYPWSELTHIWG